jgi:hypothetical protein
VLGRLQLMVKRERSPGDASDGASADAAFFGRHPSLSEESQTVSEHIAMFDVLPNPLLLSQIAGIAARLQLVSAAVRFNPVSVELGGERERLFLEGIRDQLHLILPDLTEAITAFVALEACLCDRYVTVVGEIESLPASQPQRRRR